jgi:hypothetical protein
LKTLLAIAFLASSLAAQTAYYTFTPLTSFYTALVPPSSVHPYPIISATLVFGNPYTQYCAVEWGNSNPYLHCYFPDGTSAQLTNAVNASVITTGYKAYQDNVEFTGTDSTGAEVNIFVTYKWHLVGGRYGGQRFDSGSVTK